MHRKRSFNSKLKIKNSFRISLLSKPGTEVLIDIEPLREKGVALGQRVAGVGVEVAGQNVGNHGGNLVLFEPSGDCVTQLTICSPVGFR